jgi:hypothetical protein
MFLFYAILVLMLFPVFGHAGLTDYYCTIKQNLEMSNDGKIQGVKNSPFLGKDFRIDRQTGIITTASKLSGIDKMRVLFRGSAKHSFIAVFETDGPYPKASLLVVEEYVSSVSKPFLWDAPGAVLYVGTCT